MEQNKLPSKWQQPITVCILFFGSLNSDASRDRPIVASRRLPACDSWKDHAEGTMLWFHVNITFAGDVRQKYTVYMSHTHLYMNWRNHMYTDALWHGLSHQDKYHLVERVTLVTLASQLNCLSTLGLGILADWCGVSVWSFRLVFGANSFS